MDRDNFDIEAGFIMKEVEEDVRGWCPCQTLRSTNWLHPTDALRIRDSSNGCLAHQRFEDSTNALVPSSTLFGHGHALGCVFAWLAALGRTDTFQ
jgi:hypothetical protein